jgi:hypothetical protein
MSKRLRIDTGTCLRVGACILVSACLASCLADSAHAQPQAPNSRPLRKDPVMTRHAEGAFEVKTTPLATDDATTGTAIGRYALVKQYHGDLEAAGKGEMLGAGEPAKGNAGYVAIEQVTGTLQGRSGSFALQHVGAMDNGSYKLSVYVVPGSGTGELAAIDGTMTITVANGKHSYSFDYTLPSPAQ